MRTSMAGPHLFTSSDENSEKDAVREGEHVLATLGQPQSMPR